MNPVSQARKTCVEGDQNFVLQKRWKGGELHISLVFGIIFQHLCEMKF